LSIELNPVGVKCNLQCAYCYEEPMRDAGNFSPGYDLAAMKRALKKENYQFSLFGGEPLLMPFADLEEMFRWGYEQFGGNGIQTNGNLITEEHLALFARYHVGVGISMDGPDDLNDVRWAGSLEKTRALTAHSEWAIRRLCERQQPPSLIITLHRGNAVGGRLHRLKRWMEEVHTLGVRYVRLHMLEVESATVRAQWALTENENVAAFLDLHQFQQQFPALQFDVFTDIDKLLRAKDSTNGGTSCIWNACDPYTTRAVRGVNGLGENTNCGRTNKDGIDWNKADVEGFERQLILYDTPQRDHGCQGCRFFVACKGQCPGTAVAGDWRNRTEHCGVWMRLFDRAERDLLARGIVPISRSPELPQIEQTMLREWSEGRNLSIEQAVAVLHGRPLPNGSTEHGDHWDAPDGYQHSDAGIEVHGDAGMTEMHGDIPHGDS
jgi:radical SAM protein with 4Fe4S-binding SPASM domain